MRNLGWGLLLLGAIGATCDDEKLDASGGSGGSATGGSGGSAGTGGTGGSGGGGVACGWQKRIGNGGYSNGRLTAVTVLSDGRLFVAGKASTERAVTSPLYYALLEADGSVVWEKTDTIAVEPVALAEAGVDGLLLAGTGGGDEACTNPQGGTDAVLWRIDRSTGNVTSRSCVGGTDDETAKAVRLSLDGVTVIGSSLSSDASGNVGESPNPGFQVTDLLIARFGELTYGELYGSEGPDSAAGFIAGGAILGNTLGDDSGDLKGQPSLGYGDIWLIAPQIMKSCEGRCASDGRWGGTGSDSITATTESGYFVGTTGSRGPEHFCASVDGEPSAWIGHVFVTEAGGGLDRATCIDARDAQLLAVAARGGAVVAVGKGTKIDELDDAETPDGRTSGALLLAFTGDLGTRTLALIGGDETIDRFLGVDITEDGCIVAVGRRGADGWIYTRPLP